MHAESLTFTCFVAHAGENGNRNDKAMFNDSHLKAKILEGSFAGGRPVLFNMMPVPELILGDAGFSLNANVITPFDHRATRGGILTTD